MGDGRALGFSFVHCLADDLQSKFPTCVVNLLPSSPCGTESLRPPCRYSSLRRVFRVERCSHSCLHNQQIRLQVHLYCIKFRPLVDSFAGVNYWYGSNSLPDALEGLPPDNNKNPRMMRRASEAVVEATGFQRYVNFPCENIKRSIPPRCSSYSSFRACWKMLSKAVLEPLATSYPHGHRASPQP